MANETEVHRLQHLIHAAAQDVDVLHGTFWSAPSQFSLVFTVRCHLLKCSRSVAVSMHLSKRKLRNRRKHMHAGEVLSSRSFATCSLPNKRIKVYIVAKHFGSTSCHPTDTGKEAQNQTPAPKSSATTRLAHFLADLNPNGIGPFDTTCLVTHDWKPASSQHHDASASEQPQPPQQVSMLQAVLQQSPSGSSARQLNRIVWLAPMVAVFSSPHSEPPQHLCFSHRSHHSLADPLRFSPAALQDDALCRLILFQVLSCLQSLHSQCLYLGILTSDTIWLAADRLVLQSLPSLLHGIPWHAELMCAAHRLVPHLNQANTCTPIALHQSSQNTTPVLLETAAPTALPCSSFCSSE